MKARLTFRLLFSGFVFLCSFVSAHAATFITSDITQDTTWTPNKGPYVISGEIVVNPNVTLIINAGTVVKFEDPSSGLVVAGTLKALGTVNQKITFTSFSDDIGGDTNGDRKNSTPSAGDWDGITLLDYNQTGGTSLSYVDVKYSGNFLSIINAPSFTLSNLTLTDASKGIDINHSAGSLSDIKLDSVSDTGVTIYNGSAVSIQNLTETNIDGDALDIFQPATSVTAQNISADTILGGGISVFANASLSLKNSTIKNIQSGPALQVFGHASVSADNLMLDTGTFDGINVYDHATLSLLNSTIRNFGGDGLGEFSGPNTITTHHSLFTGNLSGLNLYAGDGIYDISSNSLKDNLVLGANTYGGTNVPLTNNWWGDESGPLHSTLNPLGLGDAVSNGINFTPWLQKDPLQPLPAVLFIPGFEGSRIYNEITQARYWEPNSNADVRKLFMNSSGQSINSVVAKDVIDEAHVLGVPTVNIYKSFISAMNASVGTDIAAWKPIAYDWRFAPDTIVSKGVEHSGGTISYTEAPSSGQLPYIISELQKLTTAPNAGKVVIVTHSNGGLIAKALVQKLEEMKRKGQSNLLDSVGTVVMVAPPQIGTPSAVAALLHGTDMSVGPLGAFSTKRTSREFGENLWGAYALLPSQKYFQTVFDPLIDFDDSARKLPFDWFKKYGGTINSGSELKNFLLARGETRLKPDVADLETPNVLNETMLTKAIDVHSSLDAYTFPSSIKFYTLSGWGLNTIKTIKYGSKKVCTTSIIDGCNLTYVIDPEIITTIDGDKTVITPSSSYGNGEDYYLNLKLYNRESPALFGKTHKDILEVSPVIQFVKNILNGDSTLPQYVTKDKPASTDNLIVSTHSPVSLDVYDAHGNHTGLVQTQNPDFPIIEENIPDSSYYALGDNSFVVLPKDQAYTIKIQGLDEGTFTFKKQEISNGAIVKETVFADLPVLPTLKAEVFITNTNTTTDMDIDQDGDGQTDSIAQPSEAFEPIYYLQTIRSIITSLDMPKKLEKDLLAKIDAIIKTLNKGKLSLSEKKIKSLLARFQKGKRIDHNLSQAEKDIIINNIKELLEAIK